jgi:NAD(P)-dependent dehydrogenase (short-subunit alcohol dehydrogenase family)
MCLLPDGGRAWWDGGMTGRLEGRRVLVTGGGSGIGQACATSAAADGAAVVVADLRPELAEESAAAIRDAGGRATAVTCDVTDEHAVEATVATAMRELGGLDGVVAAAGIATGGRTHDLSLHDWELVLRVNLTGVFLTLKHALPALVDGGGSIVTIGSVSSVVIGAGGSAASYKAAKGGVLQLTKSVAVEYATDGVRANCVCPGAVATNLGRHSRELASVTTTARGEPAPPIEMKAPMPRAAAPSEVGTVVSFLLSDDASFMTGSAVMVDGGYTAI